MATKFASWEAARDCTHGPGPGARALMFVILLVFPRAKNWGIFNCRNTALGNRSAHGEGRALDVGCSIALGRLIVALLLRVGPSKLGISAIIHNKVIYSAKSPRGRRYPGHPHHDHVHIEMTRSAAERLTVATAKRLLIPAQRKPSEPEIPTLRRTLKEGSQGEQVKWVQSKVGVHNDGIFGPKTEVAVKRWQRAHDLKADGVVGPKTWVAMHAGSKVG